jgi:hypothetical protein
MHCSNTLDTDDTDALVDALTCHVVLMTREGRRNVEDTRHGNACHANSRVEVHGRISDIASQLSSIGRSAHMQNVIHHTTRLQCASGSAASKVMHTVLQRANRNLAPLTLDDCFALFFHRQQIPRWMGSKPGRPGFPGHRTYNTPQHRRYAITSRPLTHKKAS